MPHLDGEGGDGIPLGGVPAGTGLVAVLVLAPAGRAQAGCGVGGMIWEGHGGVPARVLAVDRADGRPPVPPLTGAPGREPVAGAPPIPAGA